MKRDMDLIRAILLKVEADEELEQSLMVSHTATPDIIAYQVALMRDAGLVEAAITDDSAGAPVGYQIFRITWTGHDFIDAMRSDTVWEKARHHVLKPAATWTFSVLLEWLREEAKRQLFGTGP